MNNLEKERRERFLKNLITEAIINVLVEQEQPPIATPGAASAAPPASPAAPSGTNQSETNQNISLTEPEKVDFTVDTMVEKLNVLRGGKSYTDPEVYGKLNTFFNGLSDEQKTSFEYMLTELSNIVSETQQQQQQPSDNSSSTQPQPPKPAPAQQSQPAAQGAPAGVRSGAAGGMTAPISATS
jgi:hypothetical protein